MLGLLYSNWFPLTRKEFAWLNLFGINFLLAIKKLSGRFKIHFSFLLKNNFCDKGTCHYKPSQIIVCCYGVNLLIKSMGIMIRTYLVSVKRFYECLNYWKLAILLVCISPVSNLPVRQPRERISFIFGISREKLETWIIIEKKEKKTIPRWTHIKKKPLVELTLLQQIKS